MSKVKKTCSTQRLASLFMPFRLSMAFSSNSVMRPDGDSFMNLLYQWCMSSARMSSRLEPWFPMAEEEARCAAC